jgi:hypothetical protein
MRHGHAWERPWRLKIDSDGSEGTGPSNIVGDAP